MEITALLETSVDLLRAVLCGNLGCIEQLPTLTLAFRTPPAPILLLGLAPNASGY